MGPLWGSVLNQSSEYWSPELGVLLLGSAQGSGPHMSGSIRLTECLMEEPDENLGRNTLPCKMLQLDLNPWCLIVGIVNNTGAQ